MQKEKTNKKDILGSIQYFFKSKLQQILFGFIIFVSIVALAYSAGFSTGWAVGDSFGKIHPIGKLVGQEANSINIVMFTFTLITIIFAVIALMFGSHNRKKYYWTNFASVGILSPLIALTTGYMAVTLPGLEKKFIDLMGNELYAADWKLLFQINKSSVGEIQTIFSIGYGVIVLSILSLVASLYVLFVKVRETKVIPTTYSEMMQKIELGLVQVVGVKKTSIDVDSESININVTEGKEITDIDTDKMRYQMNNKSYLMVMLSVVLIIIAGFITITYSSFTATSDEIRVTPTITTAIDVSALIILLLATFLAAEKVKVYQKVWVRNLFIIAAINLVRIFFEPTIVFNRGELPFVRYVIVVVLMVAAIALQVLGAVITYKKAKRLEKHLKELGE